MVSLETPTKNILQLLRVIGCLLLFLLLGKTVRSQKQEQQQQDEEVLLVTRRLRSNRDTNVIGRAVGSVLGLLPLDDILAPDSTIAELEAARKKQEEEEGQVGSNVASTLDDVQLLTCTRDDACTNDSLLEGGTKGSWVCRNNLLAPFSVCIPSVLGVTAGKTGDTCGCCNGNCPVKCQCGCGDNSKNVLTHWNLLFGLLKFEQCLDPTVAGAATTFSTFDIACSTSCLVEEGTTVSDGTTEETPGNDVTPSSTVTDSSQ